LKMGSATITELANRGAEAAAEFDTFDFNVHRWTRYRVAAADIDEMLDLLSTRYEEDDGYQQFLNTYGPASRQYKHGSPAAAAADAEATAKLMATGQQWHDDGHPATAGHPPNPSPALRTVPRQ